MAGHLRRWIFRQISDITLPHAKGTGCDVMQFKAHSPLAQHTKEGGLHGLKFPYVCQATNAVKSGYFTRHLNFFALFNRYHSKRLLLLMAPLNEVEVTHLKNLKLKHALREQTG